MKSQIYENLVTTNKDDKANVNSALEALNDHLKNMTGGDVELETECNVNFFTGEVEVRYGGRNSSSSWSLSYRCKKPELLGQKAESNVPHENIDQRMHSKSAQFRYENYTVPAFGYENILPNEVEKARFADNFDMRHTELSVDGIGYTSSGRESLFDSAEINKSGNETDGAESLFDQSESTTFSNCDELSDEPNRKEKLICHGHNANSYCRHRYNAE